MSKVAKSDSPSSLSDYHLEMTEDEFKALRAAVEDADGRKSEVKKAKQILGI